MTLIVRFTILIVAAVLLLAVGQAHIAYSADSLMESSSREIADIQAVPLSIRILTLDQCIALAFENNPGLQIEREKINELENDYRIASGGLYPKVTASAYYSRNNLERVGIQPMMQYTEESLQQVKLKQLLYDGGKTIDNARAAAKAADAQRDAAEATRLDTVYAVNQAYYRVLETRELLRVEENSDRRGSRSSN